MKKLFALLLSLSMLLGAVVFAEEMTVLNKDVLEGQTTVSLTIDPEDNEFVVVIPATADVDAVSKTYEGQIVLKSGWKLASCNGLSVKLKASQNYKGPFDFVISSGGYWHLVSEAGKSAQYAIAVKPAGESSWRALDAYDNRGTGSSFWTKVELINVSRSDDNSVDTVCDIRFRVPTLPTEPGVYTDVLTFAITLK